MTLKPIQFTTKFLKRIIYLLYFFFLSRTYAQKQTPVSLTQPGNFTLGCNYWASHAGTNMWKDWRPDVVEAVLKQISNAGIQIIRVFPIWPDFQPIYQFYSSGVSLKEIRFKMDNFQALSAERME